MGLMFSCLLSAIVRTCWNRLLYGPKRPGWSFTYQLRTEVTRTFLLRPNVTMEEIRSCLSITAEPIEKTKITQITLDGMNAEWVIHETSANSTRFVLFLHGGGYFFMSPEVSRGITSSISKYSNAKVLAIDYRLAPEHPFPAALEDAVKGYKWLLSGEDGPKAQPSQIAFAGDSAGGGLTFATLLKLKELGIQLPAAACGLSPWVDLTWETSANSIRENKDFDGIIYAKERNPGMLYAQTQENLKNPLISPYFGDVAGFPPSLVQVGGAEIVRDEGILFVEKLKKAGVKSKLEIYPNMTHVFQFTNEIPEAITAFKSMGDFFKDNLKSR